MNLVPGFDVDQLLGFGGEEQLGNALAVPNMWKSMVGIRPLYFQFLDVQKTVPEGIHQKEVSSRVR